MRKQEFCISKKKFWIDRSIWSCYNSTYSIQ